MINKTQPEIRNINLNDGVLVEQAANGDSSALERLIIKYQNRIYNVIIKICGNSDDALELTQETFVKVIENIEKFEGKSSFYTWLYRVAVNLTLNHCKRSVRLGFKSLDQDNSGISEDSKLYLRDVLTNDAAAEPSKTAQKNELNELVQKSIMKLDNNQRAVLILRDIENMPYDQIAEVLEIELGTVKSRISRARNNLKEILEMVLYND